MFMNRGVSEVWHTFFVLMIFFFRKLKLLYLSYKYAL